MTLVGVDGSPGGWVAVVGRPSATVIAVHAATLELLAERVPDAEGFAVDIPIGLSIDGPRRADVEARQRLRQRRSSVFLTPFREALTAPTHAEASRICRHLTGAGVSQQAYALRSRILEAEAWCARASAPVWEVHPEVSFAVMLDRPARWPKTTWAGARERLQALAQHGIVLDGIGEDAGPARVDDVLDAAAALWSAARLQRGEGLSLPDPPERDPVTGREIAIWA